MKKCTACKAKIADDTRRNAANEYLCPVCDAEKRFLMEFACTGGSLDDLQKGVQKAREDAERKLKKEG